MGEDDWLEAAYEDRVSGDHEWLDDAYGWDDEEEE